MSIPMRTFQSLLGNNPQPRTEPKLVGPAPMHPTKEDKLNGQVLFNMATDLLNDKQKYEIMKMNLRNLGKTDSSKIIVDDNDLSILGSIHDAIIGQASRLLKGGERPRILVNLKIGGLGCGSSSIVIVAPIAVPTGVAEETVWGLQAVAV